MKWEGCERKVACSYSLVRPGCGTLPRLHPERQRDPRVLGWYPVKVNFAVYPLNTSRLANASVPTLHTFFLSCTTFYPSCLIYSAVISLLNHLLLHLDYNRE